MATPERQRLLEVLATAECRRLLATASVGRIAFTEGAMPAIQPASFTIGGDDVLIPTGLGSKMAAGSRAAVLAFEVDDYDLTERTGWNVTVVGPSRLISDPDQIRVLDNFGVRPWAPASNHCYIAVRMAVVRGRRISSTVEPLDRPQASGRSASAHEGGVAMQVRDVMTHEVVTVDPGTSARAAARLMVAGGFAALPVVDDWGQVVGMVAESDVLADRLPEDPRLHLRRLDGRGAADPALLVGEVMTRRVRSVEATADVADVVRIVVQEKLRSLPVMDGERLAGIVSRRDLLRALVRRDAAVRDDVLAVTEEYTGDPGCWDVAVSEGVASIQRTRGEPDGGPDVETGALHALALTVAGVVAVRTPPAERSPDGG